MKPGERRVLIPLDVAVPPSLAALRVLQLVELGGETMGTTWSVKLAVPRGTDIAPLADGIDAVLARIISEMSPWERDSDLSRFNAAPPGTAHTLPDGFFKVLSAALHWAELSGGAFDPTLGSSVALWGFGPAGIQSFPDDEAIRSAQARSGWRRIALDPESCTVVQPGGVALDLCAIAKGFAVDEVVRLLRVRGVGHMLVEIGGELRGEGLKPDGSPWWIAFERPRAAASGLPETLLALTGRSVATSGDERRYFDHEGRRYAHTMDPRTGAPVGHGLISVTVVAENCMTADALATVLTVLGREEALNFAARHAVAARLVSIDDGTVTEHLTSSMQAMLD